MYPHRERLDMVFMTPLPLAFDSCCGSAQHPVFDSNLLRAVAAERAVDPWIQLEQHGTPLNRRRMARLPQPASGYAPKPSRKARRSIKSNADTRAHAHACTDDDPAWSKRGYSQQQAVLPHCVQVSRRLVRPTIHRPQPRIRSAGAGARGVCAGNDGVGHALQARRRLETAIGQPPTSQLQLC
jgi:hypothetical protein